MAPDSVSPQNPTATQRLRLERMRTRVDFLRAQKGPRQSRPGLGLETCPTPEPLARAGMARVGFTASRKVGGAVQRNRAKRRLREAAASILPLYGREQRDYVLVARQATLTRDFSALLGDLAGALEAIHKDGPAHKEGLRKKS